MSWFRWVRRPATETSMIPAVSTPVVHVVGPGSLTLESGRIIHEDDDGRRQATVLLDGVELISCYGRVTVEPSCLAAMADEKVAVAFLTSDGSKMLARITAEGDPRVIGRVMQHRVLADETFRDRLARPLVAEKIHSQAAAARHYQRQGKGISREAITKLADLEKRAAAAASLQSLLGIEGTAAVIWFDVFGGLLTKPWEFRQRSRRPPRDPVNALMSLGYTMLQNRITAACQAAGLETALGPLHAYRPGRPSLACDLMEPLRAPVVDRWVVRMLNQNRVHTQDFHSVDGGGVRLTRRAFPRVLANWEKHWQKTRMNVVISERVRRFFQDVQSLGKPFNVLRNELENAGIDEIA
jgi:CRISPR-associated protein Cas1